MDKCVFLLLLLYSVCLALILRALSIYLLFSFKSFVFILLDRSSCVKRIIIILRKMFNSMQNDKYSLLRHASADFTFFSFFFFQVGVLSVVALVSERMKSACARAHLSRFSHLYRRYIWIKYIVLKFSRLIYECEWQIWWRNHQKMRAWERERKKKRK